MTAGIGRGLVALLMATFPSEPAPRAGRVREDRARGLMWDEIEGLERADRADIAAAQSKRERKALRRVREAAATAKGRTMTPAEKHAAAVEAAWRSR